MNIILFYLAFFFVFLHSIFFFLSSFLLPYPFIFPNHSFSYVLDLQNLALWQKPFEGSWRSKSSQKLPQTGTKSFSKMFGFTYSIMNRMEEPNVQYAFPKLMDIHVGN